MVVTVRGQKFGEQTVGGGGGEITADREMGIDARLRPGGGVRDRAAGSRRPTTGRGLLTGCGRGIPRF